jgi:hypothetical protein
MKMNRLSAAAAALLLLPAATLMGQVVPRPAPEFSVLLPTGKKAALTDYKGKVVVLVGILTT